MSRMAWCWPDSCHPGRLFIVTGFPRDSSYWTPLLVGIGLLVAV